MEASRPNVFYAAALFEGGAALLALLIGWFRGESPWTYIRWEWQGALLGAAAAVPMLVLLIAMRRFPVGPLLELRRLVDRIFDELFAGCTVWQLLFVSIVAGFGEELLFRGIIQHVAALRFGDLAGVLVGGLVFGLAHPLSKTYFVLAAAMGCYLGWLWLAADGNLLAPIITHAAYDFAALAILMRPRTAEAANV